MPLRVYICPWVGSGVKGDGYRSKAWDFPGYSTSSIFPTNLADGSPASPWVFTRIISPDFTAIDADPSCDDLFAGDLPNSIQSRADLAAFLKGRTVGNVPTARRNTIMAVIDKYGVDRSDFNLSTPLWRVVQRVAATLLARDGNGAAIDTSSPDFEPDF